MQPQQQHHGRVTRAKNRPQAGSATLPTLASAAAPRHNQHATRGAQRLSLTLGWLSIGLGVAALARPALVMHLMGGRASAPARWLVRGIGVRELVSGLGLFTRTRPMPWAWTRLVGDALDVGLVFAAAQHGAVSKPRAAAAQGALSLITALDALHTARLAANPTPSPRGLYVNASITTNRTAAEAYQLWRDLPSLPRFLSHVEAVSVNNGTSHWRARLPAGVHIEWDAVITTDIPGERLAWRTTAGSELQHHGSVEFATAPGQRGTEVHVTLFYEPPAGAAGAAFMRLFDKVPRDVLRADLRRFKQVLETGHTTSAQGPHQGAATPHENQESRQ